MKRTEFIRLHNDFLKTNVMNAYRYCVKVYDGGIETYDHFQSFTQLCQNFVDMCNFMSKNARPLFGIFQFYKYTAYKDLNYTCAWAVAQLNKLLQSWQEAYDKQLEEAEMYKQIEARARIDNEIAIEYRENELAKQKEYLKSRPIGYNINKSTTNE